MILCYTFNEVMQYISLSFINFPKRNRQNLHLHHANLDYCLKSTNWSNSKVICKPIIPAITSIFLSEVYSCMYLSDSSTSNLKCQDSTYIFVLAPDFLASFSLSHNASFLTRWFCSNHAMTSTSPSQPYGSVSVLLAKLSFELFQWFPLCPSDFTQGCEHSSVFH